MVEPAGEVERNIEQWKVKRLIDNLDNARGNGTSLISLIIPARDQLNLASKLVNEEYGKASNIKSRVVRQAVQSAISSVRERLKLYSKVPPNGLIIYCGEVINEQGVSEKKYTIDFEPFKPLNTSLYLCDNKFHTAPLKELLECDDKFGFIIMDGNGALYGTVQGRARDVLYKFAVDLPKKHGRGGQSALRFARLRMEKRHNYVRRVSEAAVQCFITNDKVNVTGIVLAGSAEFKKELSESELLDQRIVGKIVKIVDVAYGGENGFNQAIELSTDTLANVRLVRERQLVCKFFDEVAQDSRKFVYGIEDTVKALEMGAVETLILHDELQGTRYLLRNNVTGAEKVQILKPEQEVQSEFFREAEVDLEILDKVPFSEWLVENYGRFGSVLEFVSDRTQEGSQFVKGFGGIGGLLRYQLDMIEINALDEDLEEDWDDAFM
jgi:peptide chain release factor subunit 1